MEKRLIESFEDFTNKQIVLKDDIVTIVNYTLGYEIGKSSNIKFKFTDKDSSELNKYSYATSPTPIFSIMETELDEYKKRIDRRNLKFWKYNQICIIQQTVLFDRGKLYGGDGGIIKGSDIQNIFFTDMEGDDWGYEYIENYNLFGSEIIKSVKYSKYYPNEKLLN